MSYTEDQIRSAIAAVDAIRESANSGAEELEAHGLVAHDMIAYSDRNAAANVADWQAKGVKLDVQTAFSVGWMDGLLVGMALQRTSE